MYSFEVEWMVYGLRRKSDNSESDVDVLNLYDLLVAKSARKTCFKGIGGVPIFWNSPFSVSSGF